MLRSWRIGTAFGIGIYVHWSLLLLLLGFLIFGNLLGGNAPGVLYAVSLIAGVFGCVALHELGHALTARQFGIRTRDITLYPIGGVARLERRSERPAEEFWIAIAGPAVNVVLAALLFPLAVFLGATLDQGTGFLAGHWVWELAWINVVLVVFNLLPIFPMDGGRVFRAFLTPFFGSLRATEMAARVGAVLALVIGTAGAYFLSNPFLPFLAAFVYLAGQQELAMVRQREYHRRAAPVTVLPAEYADIPSVELVPPSAAFSGVVWDPQYGAWVVWRDGRPVQRFWAS
jgi:Zn-dependent protease